jgi:mRNA interferase RelE/StbE
VTFRIEFTKSAAKALAAIPRKEQKRIARKIESLAEDPPAPAKTKIKGDNPFHRVRVGDYRIIYEIQNELLLILILKIGHRKEVYRRLS